MNTTTHDTGSLSGVKALRTTACFGSVLEGRAMSDGRDLPRDAGELITLARQWIP